MGLKQIILEDTTDNNGLMVKTQQYWASILNPYIKEGGTGFIDGIDLRLSVNDGDYEVMTSKEIFWNNEGFIDTENYSIVIGSEDLYLYEMPNYNPIVPNATVKIALFEDDPQPVPEPPTYLNTKTPLERIAEALEGDTSTESGGTKTVVIEDVVGQDYSKLAKLKNEYIDFFTPYSVWDAMQEYYVLNPNVTMNIKITGTGTTYDGNGGIYMRKIASENIDEINIMLSDEDVQYHIYGDYSRDYMQVEDEGGEGYAPGPGSAITITLTVPDTPQPDKPGYMQDKSPLERIADALEKQIGEPSEDKGYLSEKGYLERIAVAVEGGAGQRSKD